MNIIFNEKVQENINLLKNNLPALKNKIFLVGGIIRDTILGFESCDLDFSIDCEPCEIKDALFKAFGIESLVNEKFYSCKSIINGIDFEFTSGREDFYSDKSRYPKCCHRVTIEKDPFRRDFNINTLMVNIYKSNEVLDYTGKGLSDLENRIIDTPIDPLKSFHEDPLRILRAIRFASRFDFKIHDRLIEAIDKKSHRIKIISKKSIEKELSKMNNRGIELFNKFGLNDLVNL